MKIEIEVDPKVLTFLESMNYAYFDFTFAVRYNQKESLRLDGISIFNESISLISLSTNRFTWNDFVEAYTKRLQVNAPYLTDLYTTQQLRVLETYNFITPISEPQYKVNTYNEENSI